MTKSKITAVTLTALTLAGTLAATSGTAQAHYWGTGVGIGIAAGALIGAAAVHQRPCVCDARLSVVPPGRALRPLGQYPRHPSLRLLISRLRSAPAPSILAPI